MLFSSVRGSMLSRAMSTTRETRRFARDTRRLGKIEQELDFQVGREVSGRTIPKPTRVILDATDKVSKQRRQSRQRRQLSRWAGSYSSIRGRRVGRAGRVGELGSHL